MFTFTKTTERQKPIFFVDDKPVFTTWKKDEKLRIPPFRDTGKYLETEEFRERYDLSRKEGKALKLALQKDTVPEGALKTKFYAVRKDLNKRLYSEIDLRGTDHEISWRYPVKVNEWPGTQIVIGSSNTGKTYRVVRQIEEALKRKKKRKFVYVSPEFSVDTTLRKLRNNTRWQKYFQGVDVSDNAYKESGKTTPDDFWAEDIKPVLYDQPEGTTIILDDAPDSVVYKYLLSFLTKYLRTGRHKKVGVVSIQHNVRGGRWTSQSFSSVKFIVLFPRGSGRGKIVEFLTETVGLTRGKARELVEIFAESGRTMTIHSWSPNILFGEKFAVIV